VINPSPLFARTLRHVLLALVLIAAPVVAQAQQAAHFVGSWTTGLSAVRSDHKSARFDEESILIQTVRASAGGDFTRLHLSNVFGESELVISSATFSRLNQGNLDSRGATAGLTPVTFGRSSGMTIPAGAAAVSDPIRFQVAPESDVVITLHIKKAPKLLTGHDTSNAPAMSFYRPASTEAADAPFRRTNRWYFISGLDTAPLKVSVQYRPRAVVTFGDSITDGAGVPPSGHQRWSDELSRRLRANPATADVGVLNAGIGGGRILRSGRGPSALERFEREVIQQTAARWVILLIGVNDLGQAELSRRAGEAYPTAADLIAGYEQMIARAHAAGIKVYASPILPYKGSFYWSEEGEADRKTINTWIRESGAFDALVDLDAALRDPLDPDYFAEQYDLGDFLHPSPAGLTAMGRAIDLALFED